MIDPVVLGGGEGEGEGSGGSIFKVTLVLLSVFRILFP